MAEKEDWRTFAGATFPVEVAEQLERPCKRADIKKRKRLLEIVRRGLAAERNRMFGPKELKGATKR
jgi:hypothetical protein